MDTSVGAKMNEIATVSISDIKKPKFINFDKISTKNRQVIAKKCQNNFGVKLKLNFWTNLNGIKIIIATN